MIIHDKTKHSFFSVRSNPRFLDWNTQPKSTKHYPHFFQRVGCDGVGKFALVGGISNRKSYGGQEFFLRTVPSAGGLYPCEVYVQIRRVKGYLDGIYHYQPLEDKLTLLYALEKDGLESYINPEKKYEMVFLISSVYFRSSWKYQDRAIRYILLDCGHQIGAICAYLHLESKEYEINFQIDHNALNSAFSFEGSEFFLCAVTTKELETKKEISKLREPIPYVSPSDYIERNAFIEECYKDFVAHEEKHTLFTPLLEINQEAILQRRSERIFGNRAISQNFLEEFFVLLKNAKEIGIDIVTHIQNIDGYKDGLYLCDKLQKSGKQSEKCAYLGLEQSMIKDANLTLFFTIDDASYYQKYIVCGVIGHYVYLLASKYNLGCSGVGAYYDDEVKEFLESEKNIAYMMIVG